MLHLRTQTALSSGRRLDRLAAVFVEHRLPALTGACAHRHTEFSGTSGGMPRSKTSTFTLPAQGTEETT